MAAENTPRPTKNERREQAREQARIAREQEKKREKRSRLLWQGGIVVAAVAILAIVGLVLSQSMKPAGPGPENMASGGATFVKDLKVKPTPALQPDEKRKAPEVDWEQLPIDVTVYVDYMCPACGAFENTYGTMLENYIGSGDITLRIYPLNFLDGSSLGTKYSTRAANLFACTVEQQPDTAFKLHTHLFDPDVQPKEATTGLTDAQLLDAAKAAGVKVDNELKQCVTSTRFSDFIAQNTKSVTETGILGLAKGANLVGDPRTGQMQDPNTPQRLVSTPTVIVNGQEWSSSRDGDLEAYILKLKAELDKSGADAQGSDSKKSE